MIQPKLTAIQKADVALDDALDQLRVAVDARAVARVARAAVPADAPVRVKALAAGMLAVAAQVVREADAAVDAALAARMAAPKEEEV